MPSELLRYDRGRVAPSHAVAQVARALNPLGLAADIVATIGACGVEIGRFKLQAAELRARHDIASQIIRTRQGAIIGLFEDQRRKSTESFVSLGDLRHGFRSMIDLSTGAGTPEATQILAHSSLILLAQEISKMHSDAGDSLIRLSDSLQLRETETAIANWRALER
jgi:hypothetical protein